MLFSSRTAKAVPPRDPAIRVIVARLAGTGADRAVLAASAEIATAFGAHVNAVHIPALPPTIAELMGRSETDYAGFGASDETTTMREARAARETFDAWRMEHGWPVAGTAESHGPSVGYIQVDGDEPIALADRVRMADISVMARPGMATLEAVLVSTGRPILLVPERWTGSLLAGAALVAWNASPQAVRALAGSLPILRAIKGEAIIYTAAERNRPAAAHDAAEYLRWHGIRTEIATPLSGDVGAGLLRLADERGAGFVVSGAFAHGRLRQSLFGGVTTHLIEKAELPVFFAG